MHVTFEYPKICSLIHQFELNLDLVNFLISNEASKKKSPTPWGFSRDTPSPPWIIVNWPHPIVNFNVSITCIMNNKWYLLLYLFPPSILLIAIIIVIVITDALISLSLASLLIIPFCLLWVSFSDTETGPLIGPGPLGMMGVLVVVF